MENLRTSDAMDPVEIEGEPLAVVMGRNAHRIRTAAGVTLDMVAQHARLMGVKWTTGRVSRIEYGDGAATLETLLTLAIVLTAMTGKDVTIEQLLDTDRPVSLGGDAWISHTQLHDILQGLTTARQGRGRELFRKAFELPLADQRVAEKLNLYKPKYVKACDQLWGRLLSVEAEERAGEGATPQKKGHVTRALMRELQAYLQDTWGLRSGDD